MVLSDLVSVLLRRDEVPHERLDLLVALVRVDAVEEGQADGVLDVLRLEALAKVGVTNNLLPAAPAAKSWHMRRVFKQKLFILFSHLKQALLILRGAQQVHSFAHIYI